MDVEELMDAPPGGGGDRKGRKEAFREGYLFALNELARLQELGFTRESERVNMLRHHAVELKAWALSDHPWARSIYAPPKCWQDVTWSELRRKVLERDGAVCSFCGTTGQLEIDHIHEVKEGGRPLLSNLRVLCKSCNLARNSQKSTCKGRK